MICPICKDEITTSALTDCRVEMTGFADDRAVVYAHDRFLHLHGVALVHPSQLTVRAALLRFVDHQATRLPMRRRLAWFAFRRAPSARYALEFLLAPVEESA